MFLKKLPKRTKLLLTIMLGLGIVACGVFIWGYSTGALKSSASIPPGATPISGKITGEVHDSATDARIAGASASAESSGPSMGPGGTSGPGTTDINGVFQIQNMASGSYKVKVTMDGYTDWTGSTICAFYEISASAGGFLGRVRLIKHDNCNLGKIVLTKTGSSTSYTIRAFAKDSSTSAAISGVAVAMAGTPGCTTGTDGKCVLKTGAASGTYTATFTKTGIYNDATVPQKCDFSKDYPSCTITASMTKSGGGTTGTGTLKGEVRIKNSSGVFVKICTAEKSLCPYTITFNSTPVLENTQAKVNLQSWYTKSIKPNTYTFTSATLRNTLVGGTTRYWRPQSPVQISIVAGVTSDLDLPFQ